MSLFAAFIILVIALFSGVFSRLPRSITLPKNRIQIEINDPAEFAKSLSSSQAATLWLPTSLPASPAAKIPWGETEKVGEHLYRTYVGQDERMGTPEEILRALNLYRKNQGRSELQSDTKLCSLAQQRADYQEQLGNLDGHKGLEDYMKDDKHWGELGITGIGENASYGYVLSGTHLIEWVFDADSEHRDNQLNPDWNLGCAGVAGVTVDILFAKR